MSARNSAFDEFPDDEGEMGEHMKAMWAGQSNVLVAVRVRPLMKHDVIKKGCVRVLDNKVVVIMDPAQGDKQDILRANRSREKQYAFDYVFDPTSSQESAYRHTTKFLLHGVLDGYNATVFAYGQTGSGKTYTMIGTPSDPGIMVRVMSDLFKYSGQKGNKAGVRYKVSVSFLEVYNENIRDLLSDAEEYLDLREDPIKGPVVAGITEVETNSSDEIMQLLHQGNAKRSQAATAANEVSSRSHAVMQVLVECSDRAPGVVAKMKVGKLSLVDLAGSERAANTKNSGQRLVEGANINRSLLALGNCINALGEKGNKGNFVPYRDSKLTRLLKDSLGGNCRTVMIANISSAESSFEETLNTLKYANRAKNIKTNVQRNELNVNYHISEYVQLINNLRGEIKVLKDQIAAAPGPSALIGPGSPAAGLKHPGTSLQALRESLRPGATVGGEGRELVNEMRQKIVENFQERMQLRRSLIELEDQNVQNGIEVSKRQLMVVHWSESHGSTADIDSGDFHAMMAVAPPDIKEAWHECEQLRKAVSKNNSMKKDIAKRLKYNEKEAEKFRTELSNKITGEDRRELMELQYQVGRLELENMELEQHRIVHESILKGKDLVIQKLRLQLAVRDKLIQRQQMILAEHGLDHLVGFSVALMEQTLMGESEMASTVLPPSPLRNVGALNSFKANIVSEKSNASSAREAKDADTEAEVDPYENDQDWVEEGGSENSDENISVGGGGGRGGARAFVSNDVSKGKGKGKADRGEDLYVAGTEVRGGGGGGRHAPQAERRAQPVVKSNVAPRGGRQYHARMGSEDADMQGLGAEGVEGKGILRARTDDHVRGAYEKGGQVIVDDYEPSDDSAAEEETNIGRMPGRQQQLHGNGAAGNYRSNYDERPAPIQNKVPSGKDYHRGRAIQLDIAESNPTSPRAAPSGPAGNVYRAAMIFPEKDQKIRSEKGSKKDKAGGGLVLGAANRAYANREQRDFVEEDAPPRRRGIEPAPVQNMNIGVQGIRAAPPQRGPSSLQAQGGYNGNGVVAPAGGRHTFPPRDGRDGQLQQARRQEPLGSHDAQEYDDAVEAIGPSPPLPPLQAYENSQDAANIGVGGGAGAGLIKNSLLGNIKARMAGGNALLPAVELPSGGGGIVDMGGIGVSLAPVSGMGLRGIGGMGRPAAKIRVGGLGGVAIGKDGRNFGK